MKTTKIITAHSWHPFGFPKPFAGFADEDGRVYLVLGIEDRGALAKDVPEAINWIARKLGGADTRGRPILGKLESYYSGETLALAITPDRMSVSPFVGEGDSLAPGAGLSWGSAMMLDAARKVAAALRIHVGPPCEESWAVPAATGHA